ncbi:LolA family protein [Mucilaginibacter antarcticus]|uniref:LolA family protein n=1 Tax=Mucilaginibacter antarcticus TaxID=1855725 RepID=UPI00362B3A08
MKKILLSIICLLVVAAFPAFAQKDAQAKVILGQVSQKYRTYNIIKSDFTFTVDNPQAGIKETRNGSLITQTKSNKYKVAIYAAGTANVDNEVINDGKTQWTYLKADKEVQVSKASSNPNEFSPAKIFTIYETGYKYLYTGDQKIGGKIYQGIDLTPESEKAQYFKIRLLIDKAKNRSTVPRSLTATAANTTTHCAALLAMPL